MPGFSGIARNENSVVARQHNRVFIRWVEMQRTSRLKRQRPRNPGLSAVAGNFELPGRQRPNIGITVASAHRANRGRVCCRSGRRRCCTGASEHRAPIEAAVTRNQQSIFGGRIPGVMAKRHVIHFGMKRNR